MSDRVPASGADPAGAAPNPGTPGDGWQALPRRARRLFIASTALSFAMPMLGTSVALAFSASSLPHVWMFVLAGLLLGAAFGAWLGNTRWRRTQWRLDADGFALRRGRLWQTETRVPASRVQHLDIKRGPLERRYALATLVVHTAGTRHSAVTVSGLDHDDAERLRDRLARQTDDGGDDD